MPPPLAEEVFLHTAVMAARVFGPTMPNPASFCEVTIPLLHCQLFTPCSVRVPKYPDALPERSSPSFTKNLCRARTSSPSEPTVSMRVRTGHEVDCAEDTAGTTRRTRPAMPSRTRLNIFLLGYRERSARCDRVIRRQWRINGRIRITEIRVGWGIELRSDLV